MPTSSHAEPVRRRSGRTAEPLDQRILRLTDRTGECWLWKGNLDGDGYGRITVNKKATQAHRISYVTFVQPIPEGMEIDHLCRVRHCVKPDHLEAVSHRLNVIRSMRATGKIGGRVVSLDDTHCVHGHPWNEENTYWSSSQRFCKPCRRIRNRKHATSRRGERTTVDHAKVAASLRENASTWSLVATYGSRGTATHVAHYVRTGKRLAAYLPAGAFEAEFRTVDGEFRVYARFVGTEGGAS